LTLIIAKPKFAKPSEMSSAGAHTGRYRIISLHRLLKFGIEGNVWEEE
jgi:hypothetical protein